MQPDILEISAPRRPFVQESEQIPRPSKRLWQEDALYPERLASGLEPNVVAILPCGQEPMHRHALVNVFSPYVPDAQNAFHLMTINTGQAYLPSPCWLPNEVGSALALIWADIIRFMEVQGATRITIGYNWSPLGLGFLEERLGGGQSLVTQFHMMICGEPAGLREERGRRVKWEQLPASKKRLFSGGDYAAPLTQAIQQRALAAVSVPFFRNLLTGAVTYDMGLRAPIACSVTDIVAQDGFFDQFLKPLSCAVEGMFKDLTVALTDLAYDELLQLLQRTKDGPVAVEALRRAPTVREPEAAQQALAAVGLPISLVDVLWEPVQRRCSLADRPWETSLSEEEREDLRGVWRKGFAYSMVLTGTGTTCDLLIAPFIYCGDCGIMEAQHVILHRPEQPISDEDALQRSRPLYDLARQLESRYRRTK